MKHRLLISLTLAFAGTAHGAEDCEALRTRIEQKIAAAGVARFTVTVVDANAPANGQVVGSCELGSRKIVYEKDVGTGPGSAPAAASPSPPPSREPMLTECKDGTVSMGGDCGKQ
ncbi:MULTISPECIES: DUF1161 domain-containing protein [unclassified Variovorax]|jgi:hypothetical protein|uniref:DUF1161 domain-containing protein n=1 Tax=unclassified Variovorax TaxID=663243 RepID=UPI000F7F7FC8|nr:MULTISPECIES: DUF1161 domain-containing protein [unclassified Variovorax]RSZ45943.1 DUF1161 domain-containing protein [Variovorax sp. 553]RSZ46603.1 DUF1161 domain-containing protein [Variovorax sp. 679]